jgi:hypothetical protein
MNELFSSKFQVPGITVETMKSCKPSIVSVAAKFLTPKATIWSLALGNISSSHGNGCFPHWTYGFGWGKFSSFLKTMFHWATVL